jgi:hypothetical protein
MSHSVPSESSTAPPAALVHFTQARPDSFWADAGHDALAFGTSLDRLFGEPGDIHVTSLADQTLALSLADVTTPAIVDDPLVLMMGLSDGLILPLAEHDRIGTLEDAGGVTLHDAPPLPEPAALCDFGALVHSILPLADGWYWDLDKAGWVVDHAHA